MPAVVQVLAGGAAVALAFGTALLFAKCVDKMLGLIDSVGTTAQED